MLRYTRNELLHRIILLNYLGQYGAKTYMSYVQGMLHKLSIVDYRPFYEDNKVHTSTERSILGDGGMGLKHEYTRQ